MTSIDKDEARAALGALAAAQRDLSEMALCPPWRHGAFALLEAALVASPVLPFPVRIGLVAVVIAGFVLCMQHDRRRLGIFINGYRRGRTRRVILVLVPAVLALYLASVWATFEAGLPLVSLVLAVITFGVCLWGSVIWQRVFLRELREG